MLYLRRGRVLRGRSIPYDGYRYRHAAFTQLDIPVYSREYPSTIYPRIDLQYIVPLVPLVPLW